MDPTEDQIHLLLTARDKARKLLEEIVRHQAEIEARPPELARAQLEAGRMAMRKAIDSATRMLQSIEDALASIQHDKKDDGDEQRGEA
jgi:hypothetical protein